MHFVFDLFRKRIRVLLFVIAKFLAEDVYYLLKLGFLLERRRECVLSSSVSLTPIDEKAVLHAMAKIPEAPELAQ